MLSSSVKDSAQQIWQAGLGAFTKAQVEGTKAYESLIKEGVSFQRKTQSAAEEKINEATQKMTSMATDISSKASGQWDKLESIFEDRVAKALNKLGVPIYGYYMNKVYADPKIEISTGDFERPSGPITIETNCRNKVKITNGTVKPNWD